MVKGKSTNKRSSTTNPFVKLTTFDQTTEAVNAVIESARGSKNKYKLNEDTGVFELHKVLPSGMYFPLDFGFLPATKAGDGDPIDVLVFMDDPTFTGCVAKVRLIGVIKAQQRNGVEQPWIENDRLLGVSVVSHTHQSLRSLHDIDEQVLNELEHFFVSYNEIQGREVKIMGRGGPELAIQLVKESVGNKRAEKMAKAGIKKAKSKSSKSAKSVAKANTKKHATSAGKNGKSKTSKRPPTAGKNGK